MLTIKGILFIMNNIVACESKKPKYTSIFFRYNKDLNPC